MNTNPDQDSQISTRDRILEAAFHRFAVASYNDTHLRDIAADVGVDVAYVHRSFGSKEKLFHAVLDEASKSHGVADIPLHEIAPLLTKDLFSDDPGSEQNSPEALMILIRSLSAPVAAGPVGDRLEQLFIEPIREKLGDEDGLRAAAIMSMLIGMRILYRFLNLPSISVQDASHASLRVREMVGNLIALPVEQAPDVALKGE